MKNWYFWGGPLLAVFLILMANFFPAITEETYEFYGSDWGLKLPIPNKGIEVLGSRAMPEENRARFSIYTFNDSDNLTTNNGWKKVTEENIEELKEEILIFQTRAVFYSQFIDENEVSDLLAEYPTVPQVGDLTFYKEDHKGSYFFALLNVSDNEVHTYQLQLR